MKKSRLKKFSSADIPKLKRLLQKEFNKHSLNKEEKVLFTEEFLTLKEARKRELYYKSGAARRKLKAYFASIPRFDFRRNWSD